MMAQLFSDLGRRLPWPLFAGHRPLPHWLILRRTSSLHHKPSESARPSRVGPEPTSQGLSPPGADARSEISAAAGAAQLHGLHQSWGQPAGSDRHGRGHQRSYREAPGLSALLTPQPGPLASLLPWCPRLAPLSAWPSAACHPFCSSPLFSPDSRVTLEGWAPAPRLWEFHFYFTSCRIFSPGPACLSRESCLNSFQFLLIGPTSLLHNHLLQPSHFSVAVQSWRRNPLSALLEQGLLFLSLGFFLSYDYFW